jgi:hypothetical protein
MKRFSILLTAVMCAGAFCAAAQASPPGTSGTSTTPSGNGAVNQYLESIPTDHGNSPTNSLGGHRTHHAGTGGGVTGGGGGGTAGGASGGGSGATSGTGATGTGITGSGANTGGTSKAVAQSTRRALDKQGAAGKAAAALAIGTAPVVARGQSDASTQGQPQSSGGSSAIGSLVSAVTGSSSNGGLGSLLPVILVVVLLGTAAMAILRRRRQT